MQSVQYKKGAIEGQEAGSCCNWMPVSCHSEWQAKTENFIFELMISLRLRGRSFSDARYIYGCAPHFTESEFNGYHPYQIEPR
jgi:hypothetical protein